LGDLVLNRGELGEGATEVGDFFGALVDEQDDHLNVGVIAKDGCGDVFEEGGLAGLGRRDDEAALAAADGAEEIDEAATGGAAGVLKGEARSGVDRGEIFPVLEAGETWGQLEAGERRRLIGARHGCGTAAPTCTAATPTAASLVRMMTATGVMPAASAASTT